MKSTSRTLPEPQEIYSIIHGTCLIFAKIKPRAQGAGREFIGHLAGKNIFSKKYAKPIDNYSGIVYNKDTIKQGRQARRELKMKNMVNVNGTEVSMDAAVMLMDDEIREAIHSDIAPCTEQEFVDEYCKRHFEKYGEDFIVM